MLQLVWDTKPIEKRKDLPLPDCCAGAWAESLLHQRTPVEVQKKTLEFEFNKN